MELSHLMAEIDQLVTHKIEPLVAKFVSPLEGLVAAYVERTEEIRRGNDIAQTEVMAHYGANGVKDLLSQVEQERE